MRVKNLLKSALLVGATASIVSIYSCGGGGGGGAEATGSATIYGNVMDGYIFGAAVYADCNGNGKIDKGEPSGFTYGNPVADNDSHIIDLDGDNTTIENYAIDISNECKGAKLYAVGGYDTLTNLAFGGVLIGKEGKYNNNVTILTSIIESADDPENVKQALINLFGNSIDNDLGKNYMEEDISEDLFKFVAATAAGIQAVAQNLGQLSVETAESIYKGIADQLTNISTTAVNEDTLKNIIKSGIAEGLRKAEGNYNVDNDEALKNTLDNVLETAINNVAGKTSYREVTPEDFGTVKDIIKDTSLGGIQVGKIKIENITVTGDNDDTSSVSDDGSFDLNVGYTEGGTLKVEVSLSTENGNLIGEGEKNVDITLAIKGEPRANDKRSAVITFKNIKVDVDNDGNITKVYTVENESFMVVDGTDANGNRAGLDRTVYFRSSDNDILYAPEQNKIEFNIANLLTKIKGAAPSGHPLKDFKLDGYRFRIGISVQGLPITPVSGNLTLY